MSTDFDTLSDAELARAAQAGSLASFEQLVYRYEGRMFRFLNQCCRNEADAADLTQEILVTAYTKLARYNPEQSFATWLFTIGRRKLIDHLRSRRPIVTEPAPEGVDEETPAVLLARQEDQEDLWRLARSVLTGIQYQTVWLKYAEELSVAQIALVLRRTQTHVKVILFRARAALATELSSRREAELPATEFSNRSESGSARPSPPRAILAWTL
jgi:RNA polymerase sigma-70 factor, ECF subfamily